MLCEKPLAASQEQKDRIEKAVMDSGVTFMTAFTCPFSPAFESAMAKVNAGEIEPDRPRPRSANELARAAERQFADGERRGALLSLRTLVQRYPQSAAARSALLDLGRELKKEGMRDHARCAYRLYLERWPDAQLRSEVRHDLARLGDGTCDGLDPS